MHNLPLNKHFIDLMNYKYELDPVFQEKNSFESVSTRIGDKKNEEFKKDFADIEAEITIDVFNTGTAYLFSIYYLN